MNNVSLCYWDLSKKDEETVLGYFLIHLLHKNGLWEEANKDVHIYIAGLLLKQIHPSHLIEANRYLVKYESDLMEWLEHAHDRGEQYRCLKFNADHLLVDSGIFLNEGDQKIPKSICRGKTYYRLTASCAQHIYRKQTGLTQIYEHLSSYFEEYQTRLKKLRKAYFQFVKKLTYEEKETLFSQVQQIL